MRVIQGACAVAIVAFFVVIAVLTGLRMDQNTLGLLGGTTIGLVVAIPATAIFVYLSMREREAPAPRHSPPPSVTNNFYTVVVAAGAGAGETVIAAMCQLGVSREMALRMLAAGEIKRLDSANSK